MSQERGELCRLLVVGPTSQVDLSLPTHIPLADLMPAVLGALGPDLADRGLEHSGWIVQRLGGPVLDESATVGDLDLLDGETVHLRPRTDQIPPLAYDDLIDGVSAGVRKRSGLWRPQTARGSAVILLGGWLAVGLVGLQTWPDRGHRPLLLAAAALLCFAGAVTVAVRVADRLTAAILGVACVVAAVLSTMDAIATVAGDPVRRPLVTITAGAAVTVLVAAMVLPRAGWRPVMVGVLAVWVLAAAALALRAAAGWEWSAIASVLVLLTTAARPVVPTLAFKLGGFTLPDIPSNPADLQKNIDALPSAELLAGAATADHSMTALYAALGTVSGTAMIWLATAPGWAPPLAAGLAATAQILATRAMTSAWHRAVLAGPALAALATWCVTAPTIRGQLAAEVSVVVGLLLVVACGLATRIPGRRFNPLWGRLGDWAHSTAVAFLVPTVAVTIGLVDLIRAKVG